MFRYETHCHTAPVSKCGRASAADTVSFYKKHGYAGVFITNHFLDGNINPEARELPYCDQIEYYFSDHEECVRIGAEIGIRVFPGVELSYKGTDFLIYGLDKEWYKAHPEILENMRHSLWQGYDLKANPIFGDFLTWVLRSSLVETGQWQSEKQVSDMFHQVNGELRAAFASGRLKKNHKIYLLHSAAGRTPEEIGMLFPCVAFNFRQMTDLSFMSADLRNAGETTLEDRCEQAAALTGVDYLTDYSEREAEPLEKAVNFGNALIRVYRVINVIFACLAVASFLLMLVRVIRKKVSGSRGTYAAILFFAFMMLAIAFAYSFAVNWFSQFLWGTEMTKGAIWQLYYTSSLVSLLGLSMASAVSCLLRDL